MVEWRYISSHLYPRHQTEVSSELKVNALFPGKESLVFIGKEALCHRIGCCVEEKALSLIGIEN
jgi:hypothetical protein